MLPILTLALGCSYAGYLKDPFTDIPAFAQVNATLYRGAAPKPEGYERLKALGVKTLICLRNKPKWIERERQAALDHGFAFVNIPLSVYTWPDDELVLKYLETILSPEAQPVFVYCSNGRDRTGAMIAVYRVIVEHRGPKEGYREALRYGFWPYRGEVVLKKYIHQLKDRKVFFEFVEQAQKNHAPAERAS